MSLIIPLKEKQIMENYRIKSCCECHKIKIDSEWTTIDKSFYEEMIKHKFIDDGTYCSPCFDKAKEFFQKERIARLN